MNDLHMNKLFRLAVEQYLLSIGGEATSTFSTSQLRLLMKEEDIPFEAFSVYEGISWYDITEEIQVLYETLVQDVANIVSKY